MKAAAVLLLLSALVPVARGACDATAITACVNTYTTAISSLSANGTVEAGLCSALQTYYTCLLNACPGEGLSQSDLDYLNQQMQQYGLNCVPVARGACDTTAVSTCLNTYLSAGRAIVASGSIAGFCSATQTYYDCVVSSCPGVDIPQSVLDSIDQQLRSLGIDCELNRGGQNGNGGGRLGQSALLLVAAALFLSIFLRG